ncbi:MAG: T9SS type A sorting domain-containing protein [Vicingus serpentipes]|nr:T9SS type A sorting domain-containing protein [Vicingus serpentipes]
MKKIYTLFIALTICSLSIAQTIKVQLESSNGSCNAYTVFEDSYNYVNWTWYNDQSTSLQVDGDTLFALCSGSYFIVHLDYQSTLDTTIFVVDSITPCTGFDVLTETINATGLSSCDGAASASTLGGTPPFSYYWDNTETTPQIQNICIGTYTVTVTDVNQCSAMDTVVIDTTTAGTSPIVVTIITTDETALDSCDGTATVSATGGTPPYSFFHSNEADTTYNTGLCSGVYRLDVTDSLGVQTTIYYLISTAGNVFINNTYSDSTVLDTVAGKVVTNCDIRYESVDSVKVVDYTFFSTEVATATWAVYYLGTVEYITVSYEFTKGNGIYTVLLFVDCVDKASGKFLKATDQIRHTTSSVINNVANVTQKIEGNIYPNPFSDQVTILFTNADTYNIYLSDISGRIILTNTYNKTNTINLDLAHLPQGQYILQVQNQEGVITTKLIK